MHWVTGEIDTIHSTPHYTSHAWPPMHSKSFTLWALSINPARTASSNHRPSTLLYISPVYIRRYVPVFARTWGQSSVLFRIDLYSDAWRSPWWVKRCIEVTIWSDESFVSVLDRPKRILLLLATLACLMTLMRDLYSPSLCLCPLCRELTQLCGCVFLSGQSKRGPQEGSFKVRNYVHPYILVCMDYCGMDCMYIYYILLSPCKCIIGRFTVYWFMHCYNTSFDLKYAYNLSSTCHTDEGV